MVFGRRKKSNRKNEKEKGYRKFKIHPSWNSNLIKQKSKTSQKGTKEKKRKEGAEEIDNDEGKSKRKKFQAAWMDRVGEDPDKPLKESSAGMEIDESELRTYNDGNPKVSFLLSKRRHFF